MSLYANTKQVIKNANVGHEERLRVLVKYKECLIEKFKNVSDSAAVIKNSLEEKLQNELIILFCDKLNETPNCDSIQCSLVLLVWLPTQNPCLGDGMQYLSFFDVNNRRLFARYF